jgi:branched-chain amino acid transport system substrate-binding protein
MTRNSIKNRAWLLPALFYLMSADILSVYATDKSIDTVRIGLLVPDRRSVAAERGASLAVNMANREINRSYYIFKLVIKNMEGPWGTGSKQAVDLVFDENVTALLGSHDGRNAHLVEQVAAKSRVVFVSAWSADPTLAQAFVPWFYNCAPDDNYQAEALTNEICEVHRFKKTTVIADDSYESKSSLKSFQAQSGCVGTKQCMILQYPENKQMQADICNRIKQEGADCIVLLLKPGTASSLTRAIRINNPDIPVYCTLCQLDEDIFAREDLFSSPDIRFFCTTDFTSNPGKNFAESYQKTFGTPPGAVSAYAFDGMNILIEAIRKGGLEREDIQTAMKSITYNGVTGLIRFDNKGNRIGKPGFVSIKNGLPVRLK